MFKNTGHSEQETFATASNRQYKENMMHKKFDKTSQTKKSVFF